MQKLYCYVDETGQDTVGRFFLVAVVFSKREFKEKIEKQLIKIEQRTQKKLSKWKKTKLEIKIRYLKEISKIDELKRNIFYDSFQDSREYLPLTAYTIAKAILNKASREDQIIILVHGFNETERRKLSHELKMLRIRRQRLKRALERGDSCIRLADALAGFLRDAEENQKYTHEIFQNFIKMGIIKKLS